MGPVTQTLCTLGLPSSCVHSRYPAVIYNSIRLNIVVWQTSTLLILRIVYIRSLP